MEDTLYLERLEKWLKENSDYIFKLLLKRKNNEILPQMQETNERKNY